MPNPDPVVGGGGHCCGEKYTPRRTLCTVQWRPTSNQHSHSSETHYHLFAEGSCHIWATYGGVTEVEQPHVRISARTRNPLIPATLVVVYHAIEGYDDDTLE
jgi:hypothetical protein